jgi:hypothetical protein
MPTTYCTTAQILAEDPKAVGYLPSGETTFDRVRAVIWERINTNLRRRSVPIDPDDLTDSTQLKNAEVYGVLAELLFKSASKAGKDGSDWYTQEAIRYQAMMEVELESPININGDTVPMVGSIRLRRC